MGRNEAVAARVRALREAGLFAVHERVAMVSGLAGLVRWTSQRDPARPRLYIVILVGL